MTLHKEDVEINEETINLVKEDTVVEIPKYQIAESTGNNIFDLNLEELIFEKMVTLFDLTMPTEEALFNAETELQNKKDDLILNTDFAKVTGKTRHNQADRDAYMKPLLAPLQEKVDEEKNKIKYYNNKIIIINDLIKAKRLQLRIEASLIGESD